MGAPPIRKRNVGKHTPCRWTGGRKTCPLVPEGQLTSRHLLGMQTTLLPLSLQVTFIPPFPPLSPRRLLEGAQWPTPRFLPATTLTPLPFGPPITAQLLREKILATPQWSIRVITRVMVKITVILNRPDIMSTGLVLLLPSSRPCPTGLYAPCLIT